MCERVEKFTRSNGDVWRLRVRDSLVSLPNVPAISQGTLGHFFSSTGAFLIVNVFFRAA